MGQELGVRIALVLLLGCVCVCGTCCCCDCFLCIRAGRFSPRSSRFSLCGRDCLCTCEPKSLANMVMNIIIIPQRPWPGVFDKSAAERLVGHLCDGAGTVDRMLMI